MARKSREKSATGVYHEDNNLTACLSPCEVVAKLHTAQTISFS